MSGITGMIVRRLWQLLPVMVVATFVVFSLVYLVPGDPAIIIAGDYATEERIAEIRQIFGFDKPMIVQYGVWLTNVLQGDLGKSLYSGEAVTRLIVDRLPHTMLLAVYGLVIGAAIGIPLGILAATKQGGWADKVITTLVSLGVAVPNFWLGILLVSLLALGWKIFPATGATSFFDNPAEAIYYATLPAVALSTGVVAVLARQVRSALLEVLGSQYIRTLRAKGLSQRSILWKHGLRNVAATMLTITGLQVNRLFSSAVVLEAVFAIPGLGSLISYSALNKDFPVVQGVALFLVVSVILTNLIVDVVSAVLDPRVAAAT